MMSERKKMSTVSVYFDTLLELNKLKRLRKTRRKHEAHMESLADVVERLVEERRKEHE